MADWNRLARRRGKRVQGDVINQKHPQHGWGRYEVGKNGKADYKRPVVFVDDNDDPDDGSGHWEYA
jgi:hypothetical protein